MKFIKRLIILSGERNKGTLAIERNAYGVFVKFNAYGNRLYALELVLSVDGKKHAHHLGSGKANFEIKAEGNLEVIHAAVFSEDKLLMYGTNQPARMSAVEINKLKSNIKKTEQKQVYTTLSLKKAEETQYEDERIADENYYPDTVTQTSTLPSPTLEAQPVTQEAITQEPEPDADTAQTMHQKSDQNLAEIRQTESNPMKEAHDNFIHTTNNNRNRPYSNQDEKILPCKMEHMFVMRFRTQTKNKKEEETTYEKKTSTQNIDKDTDKGKSIRPSLKLFNEQARERKANRYDGIMNQPQPRDFAKAAAQEEKRAGRQTNKIAAVRFDPHISARESTFFERNGEEIERLFSGPRERDLEQLLPGSKWVKINYDDSGKHYVIGLVGKEFLCYGVPASYTPVPPEELKGYSWWLPIKSDQPEGRGYWIMYQNLSTGETVLPPKSDN